MRSVFRKANAKKGLNQLCFFTKGGVIRLRGGEKEKFNVTNSERGFPEGVQETTLDGRSTHGLNPTWE